MTKTIRVDAVVVGKRVRRNLGDLSGLKASIEAVGLLSPILVKRNDELIAGARRLEAVRQLGWDFIEVRVADDLDDALSALRALVGNMNHQRNTWLVISPFRRPVSVAGEQLSLIEVA